MFAHYDSNGDNLLQAEELWRASEDDKMAQLSQACILADMLVFDDVDKDGTLSVAEFYGAFNRLDSKHQPFWHTDLNYALKFIQIHSIKLRLITMWQNSAQISDNNIIFICVYKKIYKTLQ